MAIFSHPHVLYNKLQKRHSGIVVECLTRDPYIFGLNHNCVETRLTDFYNQHDGHENCKVVNNNCKISWNITTLIINLLLTIHNKTFKYELTLASDPLAGSVRQKAAMFSPTANLGRYCCFCSGVPNNSIPLKPMDWK